MSGGPADLPALLEEVRDMADRGVRHEREGAVGVASYYYLQASRLLLQAVDLGASQPELKERAVQYRERGELLVAREAGAAGVTSMAQQAPGTSELGRAYSLVEEALELDEAGKDAEALTQYLEAVELCLATKDRSEDPNLVEKLSLVARQALERAEALKGRGSSTPSSLTQPTPTALVKPLGNLNWGDEEVGGGGGGNYTAEEKKVLAETSTINGRQYLPFIAADLGERFAFPMPWSDPAGLLALSPKQRAKLTGWCRPEEFMAQPKMIEVVDCYSVKQTCVSDCSFVASIAITAQYEKKFKRKLITHIIFPQDKARNPVYNPAGKYMVKLHLNGVARKVVVDDQLPVGRSNEPLCSYSSNRNELWISLLEKAYMKVMGGYDFPGSNSNIDLYALTGWIPERVAVRPDDPSFNAEATFKLLLSRFPAGHVLVTAATGEMSEATADRAGLVPTHAYAVLDVREVEGVQLFKLKNPWAHLRWRGNWSELDTGHWTPSFRQALDYNPDDAANFDNGVFWIDYKSLQHYFDVLYMNWDPGMFPHTSCLHQMWSAGRGPAKDMINIGENPQMRLEVRGASNGGAVWLLLSRHITDIEDFRNNKEYITLLVYKNDGQRVYYPYDPPPYIDGVRINSPHYLAKVVLSAGESVRRFTLVVSQFEKTGTINFSVRAYSTLPFSLEKIKNPWRHKEEVTGQWKGVQAGGCANNRETWPNNPRYQLTLDSPCHLQVQLKGPKQYQMGFDLITVAASDTASPHYFKKKSSGLYRSGFVVVGMEAVAGTYDLVPSTYLPNQEAPFFLSIACSHSFKLTKTR